VDPGSLIRAGVVTLAVNRAYPRIAKPDFWVGNDHPACFAATLMWEPFPKILRMCWRDQKMFGKPLKMCPNTLFVDVVADRHPLGLWDCRLDNLTIPAPRYNTFETALHLAVWMGARQIHLLGCDFGGARDYYDQTMLTEQQRGLNRRLYNEQVHRLRLHALEGDNRGIHILSCTPRSPINDFLPFVPLHDALMASSDRIPQGWTPAADARDAALCRPMGESKRDVGVVVGVTDGQADLLPGWLVRFLAHNPNVPLAVAAFDRAVPDVAGDNPCYHVRAPASVTGWFRKPFALLQAPFERVLWLDVDCVVRGDIRPLLREVGDVPLLGKTNSKTSGNGDWFRMMPRGAPCYCTGAIGLRRKDDLLAEWALNSLPPREHTYRGDHEILSWLIHRRGREVRTLTDGEYCFWKPNAPEPRGMLFHYAGIPGKEALRALATSAASTA